MHGHHRRQHRQHRRRSRHAFWGMPRGRLFGRGELRLALLSLLEEGPQHGYELMKKLESRSGGMYRASAGSVYPTLQQLEDEGLARSESSDGKRVYRISDEGRAELEEESTRVRRIWRRADEWGDWSSVSGPEAWEIARPARKLAKAALHAVGSAYDDPDRIDRVRAILEKAMREIEDLDREDVEE